MTTPEQLEPAPNPEKRLGELDRDLCILQSHLDSLQERIRRNELIRHRFRSIEMTLLGLSSLRELVEHVLDDIRNTFDLDAVTFFLVDEQGELADFLQDDGLVFDRLPGLLLARNSDALELVFRRRMQPYLGSYRADRMDAFFPDPARPLSSIALLPLTRRGKLLGSLNLGSADVERFSEQMATDFLDQLASVLAVCVENTINFEMLRRTSLHDTLTGVNNRRYFEQRMSEEIDRAYRTGEKLSCLFLDIDHFKRINDTHGHPCGDRVLIDAAQTIRSMLRNNDILARYGGEEFVVLLTGTAEDLALDVAERIRRTIADRPFTGKNEAYIDVRLSIGVATLNPLCCIWPHEVASSRLIEAADTALYEAKNNGRNRVVSGGCLEDSVASPVAA